VKTTGSVLIARIARLSIFSFRFGFGLALALPLIAACSSSNNGSGNKQQQGTTPPPADGGAAQPDGPVTLPFLLSDEFKPSGYMGDSQSDFNGIAMSRDATDCKTPRTPDAAGDCYTVKWTPTMITGAPSAWVGVYWQYPANNWGGQTGLAVEPGATKVTFYAAGAKGGESLIFTVGGVNSKNPDPSLPNQDSFTATFEATLTTDWTQYTVPLNGAKYTDVIGGFSWVAKTTTSDEVQFYIDDVRWEK